MYPGTSGRYYNTIVLEYHACTAVHTAVDHCGGEEVRARTTIVLEYYVLNLVSYAAVAKFSY